jgi:cyclic beta-1,2-glucan synthetase
MLYRQMAIAVAFVLVMLSTVALIAPTALQIMIPWGIVWLLSPGIAFWISRPNHVRAEALNADDRQWLRCLARRTWYYFERLVGPEDNWLPPDHFQEAPLGTIAHHTSPTNLGMLLLSTLAASDLGYLRRLDMIVRLQATFETMHRLERYRGHFMNWYDTRTLATLPPAYVSMVDSGNLAACLLALRQGCLKVQSGLVMRWERYEGLLDLFELLRQTINNAPNANRDVTKKLNQQLQLMRERILSVNRQPALWYRTLDTLIAQDKPVLDHLLLQFIDSEPEGNTPSDVSILGDLQAWSERIVFHLDAWQDEWDMLVPWQRALMRTPAIFEQPALKPAWQHVLDTLPLSVSFENLAGTCQNGREAVRQLRSLLMQESSPSPGARAAIGWCDEVINALGVAIITTMHMLDEYRKLADEAENFVQEMDFGFLFNAQREVFHIGYNVTNSHLDQNYYDLLSSEARIGSLVAIAKGDVPVSHWLHLGRPLTRINNQQVMLSWSGTMFEYLMPSLLMRNYPGTLLHQTCNAVVNVQIDYGARHHVPWGISESGYYAFDSNQNYQYRAFGVPGLGYKRGLADDLVIAPYAAALSLSIQPAETLQNLRNMADLHFLGRYGFYDAIDYTPARLPPGNKSAIVQSYLAHHQGMSLLALDNYLHSSVMIDRFHADPRVESVELLLQEKIPVNAPLETPHTAEQSQAPSSQPITISSWDVPTEGDWPQVHVLSHGGLSTVLTSAGAGFCQWQEMQLTRWNADPTLENSGTWVYIQERRNGQWSPFDTWSATHQPISTHAEDERASFHAHQVAFQRSDDGIATQTEITVVPDDNVEIRRITLTNHTDSPRHLRLTSYAEVVLAPQATDQRHPAFNKLFIESERLPDMDALLFHRRPRSANEKPIHLLHDLVAPPGTSQAIAFETSRVQFIGRGRDMRHPIALERQADWLSGTTGATLDPIMAIGVEVDVPPHEQVQLAYLTMAGNSREDLIQSARRFRSWPSINQAFDQSRAQADLDLRRRGYGTPELARIERVLSSMLYPNLAWRAAPDILATNNKGQNGLWSFGISGDYPILLARLRSEGAPIIAELLQAHHYWRDHGITVNLVFLNELDTGYDQSLSNYLYRVLTATNNTSWLNRRDGIFILRADQMGESDRVLLQTAARAVFDSERGPLADQLQQARTLPPVLPQFAAIRPDTSINVTDTPVLAPQDLRYANGYGGFSADGKEYVIYLPNLTGMGVRGHKLPPAPWSNIIANAQFGFLISESGSSSTWSVNSGENRLTPWNNDPVSDPSGEAIYLRDEETSAVWSPTPRPAGANAPYRARYGAGYAIFEHNSHALVQRLRCFIPPDAQVKLVQLELKNTSDQPRRITATYYAEWVLGTTGDDMRQFIVPEFVSESQALLAHNAYSAEFNQRVAFVTANQPLHGLTADRTEFIGRQGDIATPAALRRIGLSGTVQAGSDPCAAIQIHIDLAPHETKQVHFAIGQGADRAEALQLAGQFADAATVDNAWEATCRHWDNLLNTVQVRTPDPAMDVMLNRWLLYQALACRIWGRTAFYQSSGAYGYRDQLQDIMALVHAAPQVTRAHILEAAAHQFEAGDVLHWWHPPSGRGIRSRCSDDLLWLPYVTAHYISATGDMSILDEQTPFLKGEPLKPDEEERYAQYETTPERYPLYEHCLRALHKGSTSGPHELPLIGTGDWNDGFNRVGINGRGESVWLGWFLYATLQKFAAVCERYHDAPQAEEYRKQAQKLSQTLDATAWDGQWYRRAYYDDGTPLGSAQNSECQIDSIAQSWALLSGGGAPAHAQRAMQSALDLLVRPADQLILLFTPPLDKTTLDPGYIRGYAPGIRENGGQYTHAAIWLTWAFAALGERDQATKLYQMLSPISHTSTAAQVEQYLVEPYVVAADIYGVAPHVGRGGWTWYTGSASWMYRLGVEEILGLQRAGKHLRIAPHIPAEWPGYEATYRYHNATYHIHVVNHKPGGGQPAVMLDGVAMSDGLIPLQEDGQTHEVTVHLL